MFDPEFIKVLPSLGVGGVLAALTLLIYRKDIKQYTELWKATTEQMMTLIRENTSSNIKLIVLIENLERHALKEEDVNLLIDLKLKDNHKS